MIGRVGGLGDEGRLGSIQGMHGMLAFWGVRSRSKYKFFSRWFLGFAEDAALAWCR